MHLKVYKDKNMVVPQQRWRAASRLPLHRVGTGRLRVMLLMSDDIRLPVVVQNAKLVYPIAEEKKSGKTGGAGKIADEEGQLPGLALQVGRPKMLIIRCESCGELTESYSILQECPVWGNVSISS